MLNDLQYRILDALYFVEPYAHVVQEVGGPERLIAAEVRQLLALRYIQALRYDDQLNDWVRTSIHDKDDLQAYRYLATKDGLLAHHGYR